jgi:hypothetical protein
MQLATIAMPRTALATRLKLFIGKSSFQRKRFVVIPIHPIRFLFLHTSIIKEVWLTLRTSLPYCYDSEAVPHGAFGVVARTEPLIPLSAVRKYPQAKNIIFFIKLSRLALLHSKILSYHRESTMNLCF